LQVELGIIAHDEDIEDQETQAMWVRAVGMAVALVAGCCMATAQAAQYTEVWNPPEARQVPKHHKAGKLADAKAVKTASEAKSKRQTVAARKDTADAQAKVEAKVKPGVKVAQKSASRTVVKSAARTVAKTSAKTASTSPAKTHLKTAATTAAGQTVKTAQSKSARTLTAAHPNAQKLAAGSASTQPKLTMNSVGRRAASHPAPSPAPAMTSATNVPVAETGNLPPILH
jgi:hypothetical protein